MRLGQQRKNFTVIRPVVNIDAISAANLALVVMLAAVGLPMI